MQSVGVWQHLLSVFKSHRGTTQQATLRTVSSWLPLLFHILHSLTTCIYYLQCIMECPLYLTLLSIVTLLLFNFSGPQSKISVIHFLHLKPFISFLLDQQINGLLHIPLMLCTAFALLHDIWSAEVIFSLLWNICKDWQDCIFLLKNGYPYLSCSSWQYNS